MSPILDLFITFLSMGAHGYQRLLKEREVLLTQELPIRLIFLNNIMSDYIYQTPQFGFTATYLQELFRYTRERLQEIAERHNERVLETTNNPISLGCSSNPHYNY